MNDFQKNGFTQISNYFSDDDLKKFESVISKFYISQALKIVDFRELALSLKNDMSLSDKDRCVSICNAMEINDKEALYQVQKLFPSSQFLSKIFNDKFFLSCAEYMNVSDASMLLLDGPGVFINKPNTERLLYKWHSEAHYYPKRRNLLNIWIPIFGDKDKHNGTMSIKVKSHKKDFPFSEYSGYNKNTENSANFFKQYEIPSNLLESYDEHFCETKRGGVVFFDRNLVHRSISNSSENYSFAAVARVWEHSNDLTLSGSLAATPYGGDIGRANMFIKDS